MCCTPKCNQPRYTPWYLCEAHIREWIVKVTSIEETAQMIRKHDYSRPLRPRGSGPSDRRDEEILREMSPLKFEVVQNWRSLAAHASS